MRASTRGDVTARTSSLHSLTLYAIAMRNQFPKATSKLVIIPHKVLRLILTHSTSGERFQKVTYQLLLLVSIKRRLVAHSLKTIEIMLIPASDSPVKNLMTTNIMYDVEKALRTAKRMDPK